MKKMLIIVMALLLTVGAFATTIRDIQFTADSTGDSPLKDQVVTVSGIVTGEPYAFGGYGMYIQDGVGPWNGIYVYLGTNISNHVPEGTIVSQGDSVTISGTVNERYGLTQIKTITSFVVEQAGVGCTAPMVIPADSLNQEKYEGCLIQLSKVAIADTMDTYGEWDIEDASGSVAVGDEASYYFWPEDYDSLISITGIMTYTYSEFKIQPRLAWDIVEGPYSGETKIYTRIQRMQQVRYSDLLKTKTDADSDKSYFDEGNSDDNPSDTTFYVKGVVTMPTGLSYAGSTGKKFIISDVHGGPWSAVLTYGEDGTQFPDLYEGDLIEMGGYIGEYSTAAANMTEFWLVGIVNLLGIVDLPDTAVITTGDLCVPETAEQWGNNIVRIENALITSTTVPYMIFEINDGSGWALAAGDSDSLSDYVAPPIMTPIESITGWIYHHYGAYVDSNTYQICPLYKEDIILGEGPAMLLEPARAPAGIPTPSQSVVASVLVSTMRNIDTAKVFYKVNDGAFSSVDMIEGTGNIWSGTIPAQADDAIVEYYYYVTDDSSDVSALPMNYDEKLFTYKVIDGAVSIYDIQYTHAESGLSPLDLCNVTFNAYLTMDGLLAANFTDDGSKGAVSVADATGAWNGVWVMADVTSLSTLEEGHYVTVTGKVYDAYDNAYAWSVENNTYVVGTVTPVLVEEPLATTAVTLADLEANPESYEGVLVELDSDNEISSINSYDFTLTSDTCSFFVDDDFVADSVLAINEENVIVGGIDTLLAGAVLSNVKGVIIYSYGSFKIEVRSLDDITVKQVEPGVAVVPANFSLHQNYPNPFNPVTTIRFDLAKATDVKLTIYDISGRRIQELVNSSMNAGSYDLRWNAGRLSSGMYLYRIETPEFTATNKLLLLK